jgi:hypothetical protein
MKKSYLLCCLGIMEGKYLEEKFDDAYEAGLAGQRLKGGLKGSLGMVLLCFYYSLTALAKYEKAPSEHLLEEVRENQKYLGWWAENCQINGQHQYPFTHHTSAQSCNHAITCNHTITCNYTITCSHTCTIACNHTQAHYTHYFEYL